MRFGLVLGAGGVVGMSYHAGVLHALEREGGLDPSSADLVVGTSAGSVVGALLRSGWRTADLWSFVREEHPLVAGIDDLGRERRKQAMLTPMAGPRARRAIGSAYVAARSVVRAPVPPVPDFIARWFPAGMFDNAEAVDRIGEFVPERWPDEPLWLVAVDVRTGRRVVLGRRHQPRTLHQGVLASCAIPGVYKPVRIDDHVLVDGGAHSSTHLDLAADAGCDLIVGVAPMAYDPSSAPGAVRQLVRRMPSRALAREARHAREVGASVLLVRPCAQELDVHGMDALRPEDPRAIAQAAYERTARLLETPRFRRVLEGRGDIAA
jgi:NTE family protein